ASASLMEDYRFRVWDVATMNKVRDFGPHSHQLTHLAFAPSGRLIGSASGDHTALIWDLTGLAPNGTMHKPKVSAEQAERLVATLADRDAVKAWDAVWMLAAAPEQALPLLKKRLKPAPAVATEQIERWLRDLESSNFAVREAARRELEQAVEVAAPALRKIV